MDLVTIDGTYSRDLDDAIAVEAEPGGGYKVSVAVSDVAAAVPIGSADDVAALERGFTTYRATRTVRPMLPTEISEDRASLVAMRRRAGVLVAMRLASNLDLVSTEVGRGTVRVARRFDHEGVLLAAEGDGGIAPMLRRALAVSEALLVRRQAAGAMTFWDAARGLVMTEDGKVLHLGRAARAYVLVQEMMIMANAALAVRMAERGLSILYRNHRAKPIASREALRHDIDMMAVGALAPTAIETRSRLVMERATLGTTAEGHYGLNLPVYGWFTSPIRRFADLVNHRILLADLAGEPAPYPRERLEEIAATLNARYAEEAAKVSEGFKRRAIDDAVDVALEKPRALGASGMTQALGAGAAGVDLGEAFFAETARRARDGQITAKDLFRLAAMKEVPTARAIVTEHLERHPEAAYSLLNHAQNAAGWKVSAEDVAGRGPDHARVFSATMRVGIEGTTFEGAAVGQQKKLTMQRALAAALIRFAGGEPPADWAVAPVAPEPPQQPAAPPSASANPKGDLLELCTARKWKAPTFESVRSGPPHAPRFDCTVVVTGAGRRYEGSGSGSAKRAAEAAAAAEVLARIAAGVGAA